MSERSKVTNTQRREDICYLNTAVGWLRIAADRDGITSIKFLDNAPTAPTMVNNPHLKAAYKQISEYFRGERLRFSLALKPAGTDFQRSVWERLADVPFGTTVTYGELAATMGSPGGAVAVGLANEHNPLPIVVPSHRASGADGDSYAFGVAIKEKLLEIETTKR